MCNVNGRILIPSVMCVCLYKYNASYIYIYIYKKHFSKSGGTEENREEY